MISLTEPTGFRFGREASSEHICYRIAWEAWAYGLAVAAGYPDIAMGHSLTLEAYSKILKEDCERIRAGKVSK